MKNNKFKKLLVTSLVATTGLVSTVGLSAGLLINTSIKTDNQNGTIENLPNENNSITKPSINENIGGNPIITPSPSLPGNNEIIQNANKYSMKLRTVSSYADNNVNPVNQLYHISFLNNTQKEGVIQFVQFNESNESEYETSNELMFKPGETIYMGIQLNDGYEDHTAREIKIYAGDNQSIYLTAQKVSNWNLKNIFEVKMPSYEETVNKRTGKSWLYNENTSVNIDVSFIKESIGTNGNDVNWDQGAMNNSRAGYVYELAGDTTWTDATQKIYEAFENKDITKPIDIYFYLNGYTLTFDVDEINLDIKSGWALHFYNNKIDRRNPITGKYGEIRKAEGKIPKLRIQGAAVFGSSVKFKYMPASFGLWFENYETIGTIGACENDPEVRLAAVDPPINTPKN